MNRKEKREDKPDRLKTVLPFFHLNIKRYLIHRLVARANSLPRELRNAILA